MRRYEQYRTVAGDGRPMIARGAYAAVCCAMAGGGGPTVNFRYYRIRACSLR